MKKIILLLAALLSQNAIAYPGSSPVQWAAGNTVLLLGTHLCFPGGSCTSDFSGGGGGAVSSVFTRTGAVTASSSDYSAFYPLLAPSPAPAPSPGQVLTYSSSGWFGGSLPNPTVYSAMAPIVVTGPSPGPSPAVAISCNVASGSQPGCISSGDWSVFNAKQYTLVANNDVYVRRYGADAAGCGSIANPCHTVGYVLANLVISPSATNAFIIHLSGRNDAETGNLVLPPYVFLSGEGTDVAAYLRLPGGDSLQVGSGWTSNGRGGIQSVYLGGGTSILFDFAAVGGSAGSSFNLDNTTVTGTLTHTGRGVNGGDFLTIENGSFIFGAASFTGDQIQSSAATFASTVTIATSATVPADATFLNTQVQGAFAVNEVSAQECSLVSAGTTYDSTLTTTGTVSLTTDGDLPGGEATLSAGTSIIPTTFTLQSAVANQPTCVAGLRGLQWLIQSASGTADIFQICQQTISGYAWVTH